MSKHRYDVVYTGNEDVYLEHHYCRDWDDEGGCYGTRSDHGFAFEDGKQNVINHLKAKLAEWETMTEEDWLKQ